MVEQRATKSLSLVYLAGYANEDGNPHMHHTIETPYKNINARAHTHTHTPAAGSSTLWASTLSARLPMGWRDP